MPLGGIYDTGTISVINGSATVVGTGVFWPDVLEGDHLHVDGWVLLVESVDTGTNTITLMKPYPGTTWATATYQLVKMSWLRYDPSTVMFQVRALLAKLNDAGLIYYTTGTPDPAIGENGDLAINTSGELWTFYTKASGVWVLQTAVVGPAHSVADFGAVSDGLTDDFAAVNAAIAAATAAGGGAVVFPVGTTLISARIEAPANITLRGVVPGGACRIKIASSYPYGVVIVSGPGCSVLDLTIDNNNTVGDSVALLMGSGAHGCSIRRNKIVGMTRYGIAGDSCSDCVIDDNEVTLTTPLSTFYTVAIYALASSAAPSRWRISNNRLNGTGIRVDGAETVSIINNIVRGCKADAAINIYTGNNHATISGNTLSNGRPGAYPVSGDPVGGMVLRGSSHVVADNLIFDHDGTGITTHCDDSIIQNNLILDVGKWAGAAPTYHTGILNFGDRNLIQGNKVAQTGGLTDILYGYNEGTGAVDSLVIDNQFVGSAGEAVFAATPGIGVYRPLRSIRGTVTLTPGVTTTTVIVPLCVAGSAVFLFPATANAAATVANAADMLYVLQANITAGQFIISHSNLATVDRTFYYHVVRG